MREDFDALKEVGLQQDIQIIKIDLRRLREDLSAVLWKSTLGKAQIKIIKRPISTLLWSFGAGFLACGLCKIFRSNNNSST